MTPVLLAALLAPEAEVTLSVRPMAAPKPALKYLLLPEVREMRPGNPVQWYVRCFQEQRNFFFGKEAITERLRLRSMPLAELAKAKDPFYAPRLMGDVDWGARLDTSDWMVLDRVKSEGAELRMAELKPLRTLGEALQLRLRVLVASRRFDEAVPAAATMFALARHLGECPVGDANLVGVAIAGLALDSLEEMVQQPGCPNLYWALSDLPGPLVDVRKGMQGDRLRASAGFESLRDGTMTEGELKELVGRLSGAIGHAREQAGRPPRNVRGLLAASAGDAGKVRAACGRLEVKDAAKLPPLQVLLLDEKRAFEEAGDERMKLLALPAWRAAEARGGLFADLLPDVATARRAQAKLQRRIALLQHVEAVRMAAATGGKPPAKFDVPLPNDPLTGEPFRYEADGATARLRVGPKGVPDLDYLISVK